MSIPSIENGKLPHEPISAMHFGFLLPVNSPYGNLTLKLYRIVQRLDHVNLRIEDLNNWFIRRNQKIKNGDHFTLEVTDDLCLGDEITFWLKRTADELIGLLYLKEFFLNNQRKYPNKIHIDSIGRLMENGEAKFKSKLSRHLSFLEKLNNISNAHKHSFMGSEMIVTSNTEICFFAIKFPSNDLKNKPEFIWIRAQEIIRDFNIFYQETILNLREWHLTEWNR